MAEPAPSPMADEDYNPMAAWFLPNPYWGPCVAGLRRLLRAAAEAAPPGVNVPAHYVFACGTTIRADALPAVEAAGDVNTLLLDKTGTITIGNREAAEFIPVAGVTVEELAHAAQLSSLLRDPIRVEIARKEESAPKIEQFVHHLAQSGKQSLLLSMLQDDAPAVNTGTPQS